MSLVVTQRPSTTISGETSTWNAVGNPILYKMTRKDHVFNQVNNASGFVQLQFNATNLASSFSIGDVVFIKSDNNVYSITATVTASAFSTNTLVTTDLAYDSSAPGGYVNNFTKRSLYRVDVEVHSVSMLGESSFAYSPNSIGELSINISGILKSFMSAVNSNPMNLESYDDIDAYLRFYIKYTEVWTGSAESQTNDSANQFIAILGSRQIPSTYGGNMAEYVTFNDGSPTANFLTRLTNPVMWRGWPFIISLLGGDDVAKDTYVNANGDTTTPLNIQGKLYSFNINEILSDDSVDTIALQAFNDDTPDVAMTGTLSISLKDPCSNPVMLLARNSLGGCLQWLFDVNQEYTFDYGGGRKAKRLVLTAVNLTVNQWEALQDFITLGDVYRENILELSSSTDATSRRIGQQAYALNQDGTKVGVLVIPTRNTTLTKQIKHIFEVEIEFPEQFAI